MQHAFDTSFEQRLAKIDLTAVMQHVARDTGFEGADLERAEDLYRKFLTLIGTNPGTSFVPPRLVDEVWHAHITFTRQYMADCDLLFGEYLHHNPAAEGEDTTPSFTESTIPAYQKAFGVNLLAYGLEEQIQAAGCGGGMSGNKFSAAGCGGGMSGKWLSAASCGGGN